MNRYNIGTKIELFWPLDNIWNIGTITLVHEDDGMYSIKFHADDLPEPLTYNLKKYQYRLVNKIIYLNKDNFQIKEFPKGIFEIDNFLERCFDEEGIALYKVKWKGYNNKESTWESIKLLQISIIEIKKLEKLQISIHKNNIEKEIIKKKSNLWLYKLYLAINDINNSKILVWVNENTFDIKDVVKFANSLMLKVSKIQTAKLYFKRLKNYGFTQIPIGSIGLRFINPKFKNSNILSIFFISNILKKKIKTPLINNISKSVKKLKNFESKTKFCNNQYVETLTYWPVFISSCILDINNCYKWSEKDVAIWLDCLGLGKTYKLFFYENAVNGQLLMEIKYNILFSELKIKNIKHQKQLSRAINILKRIKPIINS